MTTHSAIKMSQGASPPPFDKDSQETPSEKDRKTLLDEGSRLTQAVPIAPSFDVSTLIGNSTSQKSLALLQSLLEENKEREILLLLRSALECLRNAKWQEAGDLAIKVLNIDERHGEAWHILGISRDKADDFANSLQCYEKALILNPDHPQLSSDLGRLAYRMSMHEMAISFFQLSLQRDPNDFETYNNIASCLRELNRMDEGIELLKPLLQDNPGHSHLWNILATLVNAKGDLENAVIFYDEAVKFNPELYHAIYNRAQIKYVMGQSEDALADLKFAMENLNDPYSISNAELAYAHALLGSGQTAEGWKRYVGRRDGITSSRITAHIDAPRYKSGDSLLGKHIFVCAEQGLGDEVMFFTILPDLISAIGPKGRLSIGVEGRLKPLFARSFPNINVYAHNTLHAHMSFVRTFPELPDNHDIEAWAFVTEFLPQFRSEISDFPKALTLFRPDPERVKHWKSVLGALGTEPKIGLLWKSLIQHSSRDRFFSPFDHWKPVLETKGLHCINLQYGDVSAELEEAGKLGINLFTPPGIDLKNDLEDLSALCSALDIVMGPSNATSNIAAASGTPIWMSATPHHWTCLGTNYYPWYPKARVFMTEKLNDWSKVMDAMKAALESDVVVTTSVTHA